MALVTICSDFGAQENRICHCFHYFTICLPWWRRKWQPTPVFLPGEFHGQMSLVPYSPWGHKESDLTKTTHTICHEVVGLDAMILVFWMLSFKPDYSLSFFTFIKRLFSSSLLSARRVVSSAYLRLLIFLPAIFITACASSSSAFLVMYSAYIRILALFFLTTISTSDPTKKNSYVQSVIL